MSEDFFEVTEVDNKEIISSEDPDPYVGCRPKNHLIKELLKRKNLR